jgi:hypothetical protein
MLVIVVANVKDFLSKAIVFTAYINFKLNAKITVAVSVENRVRFVAIVLDRAGFVFNILQLIALCNGRRHL